jgi:hypothetical protein
MVPANYQTITLSRGKHHSPNEGACVMELVSMLAGEPFSDHPLTACPVVGSFLRAYNDSIDDERRQDLYAYAAKVIGSRASAQIQAERAARLTARGMEFQQRRWTRFFVPRRWRSLARTLPTDVIGILVVRALGSHGDKTHSEALALVDELLAIKAVEREPLTIRLVATTAEPAHWS